MKRNRLANPPSLAWAIPAYAYALAAIVATTIAVGRIVAVLIALDAGTPPLSLTMPSLGWTLLAGLMWWMDAEAIRLEKELGNPTPAYTTSPEDREEGDGRC